MQHEIPRFYYPNGPGVRSLEVETQVRKIKSEFDKLPGKKATRPEMARIVRACNLPLYWKDPLFYAITDAVFAPFTSTITPANTSANNKSNTSASSITSSSDTKQQPQINNINNQNELLKNGLNKQNQQPSTKSVITCDEFIDYWKRLVVCCAHFIIMVWISLSLSTSSNSMPNSFSNALVSHQHKVILFRIFEYSRKIASVLLAFRKLTLKMTVICKYANAWHYGSCLANVQIGILPNTSLLKHTRLAFPFGDIFTVNTIFRTQEIHMMHAIQD